MTVNLDSLRQRATQLRKSKTLSPILPAIPENAQVLETSLVINQTPVGFSQEALALNKTLETPTFSSLAFQMLELAKLKAGFKPSEIKEDLSQDLPTSQGNLFGLVANWIKKSFTKEPLVETNVEVKNSIKPFRVKNGQADWSRYSETGSSK